MDAITKVKASESVETIQPAEVVEAVKDGDTEAKVVSSVQEVLCGEVLYRFDREFYEEQVGTQFKSADDAFSDYMQRGWRVGLDPVRDFSTQEYLSAYDDIVKEGINPYFHYQYHGIVEGRRKFDSKFGSVASTNEDQSADGKPVDAEQTDHLQLIKAEFDPEYYKYCYADLAKMTDDEAFHHYMDAGWKEHRNPSSRFNTSYYLKAYPDIRSAGINPFMHYVMHGRKELRHALPYSELKKLHQKKPLVSVIVPNYNHAKFLKKRIESIVGQTYSNIELIILDDCSTDNSRSVIDTIVDKLDGVNVRKVYNESNSGGVFYQWKKGLSLATGDLIWICESDDYCESDFLSHLVHYFSDPSVMIAFGRIQFCDSTGKMQPGLDSYREQAEAGIWEKPCVRPASQWFRNGFAISNVIPNVGGCIFRNRPISDDVWAEMVNFRVSGDWMLYLKIAGGGRIAYDPLAVAYFRQHAKNTSVTSFVRKEYYKEHEAIGRAVRKQWGTSGGVVARFYANVVAQYEYAQAEEKVGSIDDLISLKTILHQKKDIKHVLICFLGFKLGGGEIFPINLANELHAKGVMVSMMTYESDIGQNDVIRRQLNSAIPVYESQMVAEMGVDQFIEAAGVDLIHSHTVAIELFFFQSHRLTKKIPYVVTLHGSYEVTPIPDDAMYRILCGVSHWYYLADNNLKYIRQLPLDPSRVTLVRNGMPLDDREFQITRESLGIPANAFVFAIASRALVEKGWMPAMDAVEKLWSERRNVYLCICGDGPDFEEMQEYARDKRATRLLGYNEKINGFYKMSNCVMLPSRFKGESFPLCLIQAMQIGRPIVATNIGKIRSMLEVDGRFGGILVEPSDDDAEFVDALVEGMRKVMLKSEWNKLAKNSMIMGLSYSISVVADQYMKGYEMYLPVQ